MEWSFAALERAVEFAATRRIVAGVLLAIAGLLLFIATREGGLRVRKKRLPFCDGLTGGIGAVIGGPGEEGAQRPLVHPPRNAEVNRRRDPEFGGDLRVTPERERTPHRRSGLEARRATPPESDVRPCSPS